MTIQETIEKAIEEAIEGGWIKESTDFRLGNVDVSANGTEIKITLKDSIGNEIIFNKRFLRN